MTIRIASGQGSTIMCHEIKDSRVSSTLSYIIRSYDRDDDIVEIQLPSGSRKHVNRNKVKESIAQAWNGTISPNDDLFLNFYINSDDQIVEKTPILIKEWEIRWQIGEVC